MTPDSELAALVKTLLEDHDPTYHAVLKQLRSHEDEPA